MPSFLHTLLLLLAAPVNLAKELKTTKIEVTHVNADCEQRAQEHDRVTWNYRGSLRDGTAFDSGVFTAVIGRGDVIKGVDLGLRGMCVGERRLITVPPHEGYGDEGSSSGKVPGGATMLFDMELTSIQRPDIPETTVVERVKEVKNCNHRSEVGDTIWWKYHGTLDDGTVFDSGTYSATLGARQVIVGWWIAEWVVGRAFNWHIGVDTGMLDMCVGDKRKLTLPHHEAYGERGYPGAIPPYATLHFDVEMTHIQPAGGDKQDL